MDIQKEKLAIIEWVVKQEKSSALSPILALIQKNDNQIIDDNKLVGYRKPGRRITKKELIESIKSSLDDLAKGDVHSLDQVEAESDQW